MMTMRKKANISLVVLAFLFLGAAICLHQFPGQWWPRMLLYTTEAGLVGALADLFAVTVLFRHPFGLKWVPHTAIIPRNRDKLVDGVVLMVEEQLLSKEMLKDKVKQLHIVNAAIAWTERRQVGQAIAEQGWKWLVYLLSKANIQGLSVQLDRYARKGLRQLNLAPYAGALLRWVLANSHFQEWLGQLVQYVSQRASGDETKRVIRQMLEREKDKFVNEGGSFARWFKQKVVQFAESADALNIDAAVETLYGDLQRFLLDLQNPKHELRVMVEEMLNKLADNLESSPDMSRTVHEWKEEMLEQLSFLPSIEAMLGAVKNMLVSDSEIKYVARDQHSVDYDDVKQWGVRLLESFWEWFKADEETKEKLESYVQHFISRMIDSEHAIIGRIVRKTLEDFTEQNLVYFIESKVETDLQRIRINGALIGAALGAAFFIILHGVYTPLLRLF